MDYAEIAKEIRKTVLGMIYDAQSSHIGSCLSVVDILSVLYEKVDFEKDELVVSKGWSAAVVYALNAYHGLIPKEDLKTYNKDGSKYIGLIEPIGCFGCKVGSGSMGHGLPMAVGQALAKKKLGQKGNIYVVMSDGELACGTTWESSLVAQQYKLDNLYILIDSNGWQAMGKTKEVLQSYFPIMYPRVVVPVDGHNHFSILNALELAEQDKGVLHVINCLTTKGKGVSFMEDKLEYHYKNISDEEYKLALEELQ